MKCPSGRSYQTGTSQHEARHQDAVCLPVASHHRCRSPCWRLRPDQGPAHHRDPLSAKSGLAWNSPLGPNRKHMHPPRVPRRGISQSRTAIELRPILMVGVCSRPHWVSTQQPSPHSPLLKEPPSCSLDPLEWCHLGRWSPPGGRGIFVDLSQCRL